jgi:hypothetical protein
VYVHVHRLRRQRQEEHRAGEAAARQEVAVHLHQGVLEHAVAHRAPIHEEADAGHARAVPIGARHKALDLRPSLLVLDAQQPLRLALSQHSGHPLQRVADRGPRQRRAIVAVDVEVRLGQRQRRAGQPVRDVSPLGLRRLEEFAPRRNRREEVRHLHARAHGPADGTGLGLLAAPDAQLEGFVGPPRARAQAQAGDRRDGRQGLAPEPVRADLLEVP